MNTEEINKELLGISEKLITLLKNLGYSQSQIQEAINKAVDEALKTPKVGDWFEANFGNEYVIGRVTKQEDEETHYFGILHLYNETNWINGWCDITDNPYMTSLRILTEEEVISFLTKEAEKRYKDGDVIYTSSIKTEVKIPFNEIICITKSYFWYKGVSVLDLQTGKWAEKVERKEEDYDVWIHEGKLMIKHDHNFIDGKYQLHIVKLWNK